MKTITLNIEGMHCGGCVKSVTRVLTELDGVKQILLLMKIESVLHS